MKPSTLVDDGPQDCENWGDDGHRVVCHRWAMDGTSHQLVEDFLAFWRPRREKSFSIQDFQEFLGVAACTPHREQAAIYFSLVCAAEPTRSEMRWRII